MITDYFVYLLNTSFFEVVRYANIDKSYKIKDLNGLSTMDEFKEKIVDGQPTIDFLPLPFNDDEIIGAFAVCQFEDGGLQYDVMSRKSLDQTRKASRMANGPAWKFEEEMFKKTVLRRLCKHIQIDFDSPEQFKYFNEEAQIETKNESKGASLNSLLVEDESEVVSEQ